MRKKLVSLAVLLIACTLLISQPLYASGHEGKEPGKTAIVIASFGTTEPSAVGAITNIMDHVKEAYPGTEVRLTFTSNIIRSVWRKRQAESEKWLSEGIPKEVLYVKNVISTLGDLREEGYRNIIVQPTHMFYMEQSYDLEAYIDAIASIRTLKKTWQPFDQIVIGRPALGKPGGHPDFNEDVAIAIKTVAADMEMAKKEDALLVYMGHGNEHWPSSIYGVTQKAMRETYPDVKTYIGVVEGYPSLDDILSSLKHGGKKKVILKPFMIVAGDHAKNDMAGEEEDSWKSILSEEGFEVQTVLEGLGKNDAFAELFVAHIKDAAAANHIEVK